MVKRILIIFLIFSIIFLTGCSSYMDAIPRIEIIRSTWRSENIILSVRENYDLAEDIYTIEDTTDGYNLIIHFTKTN